MKSQTSKKKVVKHEELEEKVSRLFMAVSVLADAVEDGQWHGVRPHVRDILYPSWARPTYNKKRSKF